MPKIKNNNNNKKIIIIWKIKKDSIKEIYLPIPWNINLEYAPV
jgi:hypothetical protein